MTDKTLRFNIFTRDTNTKRTLDGIADAAEDAGDEFAEMARDAKRSAEEVEDLEREINQLKRAMVGVDGDMFKDMDRQLRGLESTLRRKMNVRKVFGDAGDDGASAMSASFAQKIGPLMLRAPISPPIIAAVAAAAPEVASLLGAAVSGGVGLGVVGIGAAIASQDERVQAAGSKLGQTLAKGMRDEANVFVDPILRGIDRAEAKFNELRPVIHSLFEVGARNADTLFAGLIDGSDEVVRDLEEINRSSEPVVNVMSRRLPSAIAATTDALKLLSGEAEHNAKTLDMLFFGLEATIAGTGLGLKALNAVAKYSTLGVLVDIFGSTDKAAAGATKSIEGLTGFTGKYDSVASKSALATKSLSEQLAELADAASNAFNDETRLGEAIAESTEKIYKNKDAVKSNTEQGRANRDMLGRLAQQTLATRDAVVAQTKSGVDGERVMQRGYDAFVKAARGMGMSKQAADALARSLGLIPPAKNVTVSVATGSATAAVRALQGKIAELKNKQVYITGTVRWVSTGLKVPGGTILKHEGGMVPGPMSVNRDVVPAMLTPGEGVLSRTGMKALDALNSGRGMARDGGVQTVRIVIEGTGVVTGLRREIRIQGGNVQEVLGQ